MLHKIIIKRTMLLILFFSLSVFSCLWAFGMPPQSDSSAQKEVILSAFEVNGKEILVTKYNQGFEHQEGVLGTKINILIDVDGYQIEPVYTTKGFLVPDEVYRAENIDVYFLFGEHKLCVSSLTNKQFQAGSWSITVGIPPFSYVDPEQYNKQTLEEETIFVDPTSPEYKGGKRPVMVYFRGSTSPEYKDGKRLEMIYFIGFDYGDSCCAMGKTIRVYK